MTTVGYGDISAHTLPERIFCIHLMLFGVISFTFLAGALSSILQNFDKSEAELQEKIQFVNKLSVQFNIKGALHQEICKSLNYEHKTTFVGMENFLESLPPHLSQAVTLAIHNNTFKQHPTFRKLNNKRLLAYIGNHLRP